MDHTLTPLEYRLIVEHSPVMIWRSGIDAKCDYFNDTWLAYTGRTLEQEMGDGWAEGVHAEDFEPCVAYYLDHFERREAFEMEYRLRRHDGVYRWIFDRGVPFTGADGNFAGFIGSCIDVHERRKAQDAEQQRNQDQLSEARDFEKWMLAIVSHDIRNPVNAIQLATHLLQSVSDPSGTIEHSTGVITRAVDRVQHIVGDLLDLSRQREGAGIPIHPEPTDVAALCRQIIEELEKDATKQMINFSCEVDGAGVWDAHRLMQAISNLARNALQHGERGSPVEIRVLGDDLQVVIQVQNAGSIPEELLPNLFQPFHSRREYSKRSDGLGLGLFIAKAIARAHGGDLELASWKEFTTLKLMLPRRIPTNVEPANGAQDLRS